MTGARLLALRESMGLTQAEFGALLGSHEVTVCRWEKGRAAPHGLRLSLVYAFEWASGRARARSPEILRSRGNLAALHALLHDVYGKHKGARS